MSPTTAPTSRSSPSTRIISRETSAIAGSEFLFGTLATLAFVGLSLVAIFMMKRTEVVVDASPEEVFGHVDDVRAWKQWFSVADPDHDLSLSGADRGDLGRFCHGDVFV